MERIEAMNDTKGPIVVLGAKPNAALPAVSAPVVVTANGAVEIALEYRRRYGSYIIGLVPGVELRKHAHIQESFKKGKPDEVIVFGNDGVDIVAYIQDELGLSNARITVYSIKERHQFMRHVLGARVWQIMIERVRVRGVRHFLKKMLPDVLLGGNMDWLSHSTGLDAIMYSMKRFPKVEQIITAGIGLQGGAHFNSVGVFMQKTVVADIGTMKHWPLTLRKNVFTTDGAFHTISGAPKWEGGVFSYAATTDTFLP